MNNFQLVNCDTDSITISKLDGSKFTEEENINLLNELNSLFPENISWEPDGEYPKFIVFKAKTYVMLTKDNKIIYKGSALKSPKLEKALQEFIHKIIEAILYEKGNYKEIYESYVREIIDEQNFSVNRWSNRITISAKTLESERTNEVKIRTALEGTEYSEGDRRWVFFKEDNSLSLIEHYNGDYNKRVLLKKLFKCSKRFDTILENGLFIDYSLKRSEKLLCLLK